MTTSNNPGSWPVYSLSAAVARLPISAQARYRALIAKADDTSAVLRATIERNKRTEERLYHHEMRLGRLDPRVEADTIAKEQADRDALRAEFAVEEQRRSTLNARRANFEQTLAQLNGYIPLLVERGAGGTLRPVTVSAQPRKSETLGDAIRRIRSEIASVQGELTRLRTAPPTAEEYRAAAAAKVQQLVAQGAPTISHDGGKITITFPDEAQFANPGAALAAPSGSSSKLQAWLFPDQMLARLTEGVDEVVGGVSKAERERRSAELAAEICSLEHQEESLVTQALDAGLDVGRRVGASPLAILGLEVETQAALQAAE
jgi:hypothetical protein